MPHLSVLQDGPKSYLFEIGHRHGNNLDRGSIVVGNRRAQLRMVSNGFGELPARSVHIRRGRMPAPGVERRQAHVVPQRLAVQKRQQVVHVERDAIYHKRSLIYQTSRNPLLVLTNFFHIFF